MPQVPQILVDLEPLLQTLWTILQNRQNTFKTNKGRYFQGIRTHSGKVVNASDTTCDNLAAKPTDQAEAWTAFFPAIPSKLPYSVQINIYNSPAGQGYEVVLETEIAGIGWRRVFNFGSETFRAQDWMQIESVT